MKSRGAPYRSTVLSGPGPIPSRRAFISCIRSHAADRFNRRKLLAWCYVGLAVCSGLLLATQLHGLDSAYPIYFVLILLGVVRSFSGPASRALFPELVPSADFPSAVAWNAMAFQSASILGPALGGLVYAFFRGPAAVYAAAMTAATVAMLCTVSIKARSLARPRGGASLATVLASASGDFIFTGKAENHPGLDFARFVCRIALEEPWRCCPVYAREILHTGPWGLGVLRSAPGAGATLMAILLANRPLRRRLGAVMMWCVAGFGVSSPSSSGLSHSFLLSFASLLLVGANDMVSVVIRSTLLQVKTPD